MQACPMCQMGIGFNPVLEKHRRAKHEICFDHVQNEIVCDICSHDDVTNDDSVNKLGEFQ